MECSCVCGICIFLFKQKTAYEMRISDWSSDVCSSDLAGVELDLQVGQPTLSGNDLPRVGNQDHLLGMGECRGKIATLLGQPGEQALGLGDGEFRFLSPVVPQGVDQHRLGLVELPIRRNQAAGNAEPGAVCADLRSEEHTSELPSLMRLSYAVF